jgi:hypothetical protein
VAINILRSKITYRLIFSENAFPTSRQKIKVNDDEVYWRFKVNHSSSNHFFIFYYAIDDAFFIIFEQTSPF